MRAPFAFVSLLWVCACGAGTEAGAPPPNDEPEPEAVDATPGSEPADEVTPGTVPEPNSSDDEPETPSSAQPSANEPTSEPESPTEPTSPAVCGPPQPGRTPLRRLSNFEYDNTVRDLLADDSRPSTAFVSEPSRYGNRGDLQGVSATQVEQYLIAARDLAARALADPEVRATHFACLTEVTPDTEAACARSIIERFGSQAFRRPLDANTTSELVALQAELRANGSFEESITSLLEAMLQGPDFLYRLEFGAPDPLEPGLLRPTGHEMATRLSYLLWGTMPNEELTAAASAGELDTASEVFAQASRMLDDARARPQLRYFFEAFLDIDGLTHLVRDPERFPDFSPQLLVLMREETLGFIENEIFTGSGSWSDILSSPSVFVNEELASYYGIPGVTGSEFRSVDVDPAATHRFGLLTQGSVLVNTSSVGGTHPFRRGLFVYRTLMCQQLPPAPADVAVTIPPTPTPGPSTTRQLFEAATQSDPVCWECHRHADPIGFALENYDAIGLWRDTENGLPIDTSASTPQLGAFNGPEELVAKIVAHEATYACAAINWAELAYGRALDSENDACLMERLMDPFANSGYQVASLLLASTQTDDFLFLLPPEETP